MSFCQSNSISTTDFNATNLFNLLKGDGCVGVSLNTLNDLATRPDYAANVFLRNFHDNHFRCVWLELFAGCVNGLSHFSTDVLTASIGLHQSCFKYFIRKSLDLDVHLAGSDALLSAGDLEVHIAQVILVAKNVTEYSELACLLIGNQSHGNATDGTNDFKTSIHHGHASGANCCHGARSIRLKNF